MRKTKILVVDDEKPITIYLKTCLESTGNYEVKESNSGNQGLRAAEEFRPDLVLLDIMMGDMSGDVFAERIKNNPRLSGIKIIFLTGMVSEAEVRAKGGFIGGHPYIAKPISQMKNLLDCIETALRD
jgi:CheY-like chemotaxis protein